MHIDEELRHRIGLALNEATLLGVEFDKEKNLAACSSYVEKQANELKFHIIIPF